MAQRTTTLIILKFLGVDHVAVARTTPPDQASFFTKLLQCRGPGKQAHFALWTEGVNSHMHPKLHSTSVCSQLLFSPVFAVRTAHLQFLEKSVTLALQVTPHPDPQRSLRSCRAPKGARGNSATLRTPPARFWLYAICPRIRSFASTFMKTVALSGARGGVGLSM